MTRYSIVPERSELAAVANSSVHPIHGSASRLEGWIEANVVDGVVDTELPASAQIELQTTALQADNVLVNREIQRRLDARRFPVVRADVTQVTGPSGGRYNVSGKLSLRHVTHEVSGTAVMQPQPDGAIQVEGELSLDLRDFQLDPPKMLGLRVYPEVAVTVRITAQPDH
jgi:polyisoprenoid-binding protein YceI